EFILRTGPGRGGTAVSVAAGGPVTNHDNRRKTDCDGVGAAENGTDAVVVQAERGADAPLIRDIGRHRADHAVYVTYTQSGIGHRAERGLDRDGQAVVAIENSGLSGVVDAHHGDVVQRI